MLFPHNSGGATPVRAEASARAKIVALRTQPSLNKHSSPNHAPALISSWLRSPSPSSSGGDHSASSMRTHMHKSMACISPSALQYVGVARVSR